ncbi:MAG: hypothetical protein GX922_03500 [Firmicutes bacterium]|nr:hypothetical protein [Bacillota bacterium]
MLDRLFKNNIVLKLAAFFMAVIFWAFVTGDAVRSNLPNEITMTYSNIPLEWLNLGEEVAIAEIPEQVEVVLRGRSDVLNGMTPQNVQAFVDLRNLGAGRHSLSPNAEVPAGVSVLSIEPQQVVVELEEVQSPQMSVVLDVMGTPPAGFVLGEVSITPSSVFVRGAKSLLQTIERVRVIVNINGAREDLTRTVPVQAVDSSGQVVEGVEITPQTVEVFVPLSQPRKDVEIEVPLTGEPAAGFKVKEIKIKPSTVTVEANEAQLKSINKVTTEPADITGAAENMTFSLALIVPENTKVLTKEVEAEIVIVPE